jgi:flagellar biosynthesis chaperone FliJ
MSDQRPDDGYPTRKQIEECLNAYLKNEKAGLLTFLKKQRTEREKQRAEREKQNGDEVQSRASAGGPSTQKSNDL